MNKQEELLLRSLAQYRKIARRFSVNGLSHVKFAIAAAAWKIYNSSESHRIRVSDLVEELGMPAPGVSRALRMLESDGILVRTTDPDNRRSTMVTFTETGIKKVQDSLARIDRIFNQVTEEMGEEKVETFCSLLQEFYGLMNRTLTEEKMVSADNTESDTASNSACFPGSLFASAPNPVPASASNSIPISASDPGCGK